jgi:hypothetical protein
MLKLFSRRKLRADKHYVGVHRPGTVEVEDQDGNVSLRAATPDEQEYARRVIARIQGDLSGPSPVRPWTDAPARSASEIADSCGIESGYPAPVGEPPLPDDYPLSGSACFACPGTRDRRCCQYANADYIASIRERLQ